MLPTEEVQETFTRTPPLIIDRKTGEPKKLYATQENRDPWKLVIITADGRRKGKNFRSYKKAKKAGKTWTDSHQDDSFTVVSRQVGYGPPYSKVSPAQLLEMNARGRFWCPYCRQFREFLYAPRWRIERCEVCRIMLNDHHVIKNNPRLVWR